MHQIRYFVTLCDQGSFARAAKRSGVSQPSVTNAIGALERELGGALFERRPAKRGPTVALTVLGRAMLPHFRQINEIADHVLEIAQSFAHLSSANAERTDQHQANTE